MFTAQADCCFYHYICPLFSKYYETHTYSLKIKNYKCELTLQTKLYELEGQVRRGAAEREAVEKKKKNEFQEEIQRQREQMRQMESLYKKQLEGAQNTCTQVKVHTNTTECLKCSGDKLNFKTEIWGQEKPFDFLTVTKN